MEEDLKEFASDIDEFEEVIAEIKDNGITTQLLERGFILKDKLLKKRAILLAYKVLHNSP